MSLLRRVLILSHRYAGLVLGLLVVMWFATGIVMMYAGGMPRLTPQMRLAPFGKSDSGMASPVMIFNILLLVFVRI